MSTILTVLLAFAGQAEPAGSAAAAFERLKGLAGAWRGSFEWSGARSDRGAMGATYYLTANGSAVVENLWIGSRPVMTSVYHMNGSDLRMTHYCAAGNQPRLKAEAFLEQGGVVQFAFVDATNLAQPDAAHVHAVEIRFHDTDRIALLFKFVGGGRESLERIELTRTGDAEGPSKASP